MFQHLALEYDSGEFCVLLYLQSLATVRVLWLGLWSIR